MRVLFAEGGPKIFCWSGVALSVLASDRSLFQFWYDALAGAFCHRPVAFFWRSACSGGGGKGGGLEDSKSWVVEFVEAILCKSWAALRAPHNDLRSGLRRVRN